MQNKPQQLDEPRRDLDETPVSYGLTGNVTDPQTELREQELVKEIEYLLFEYKQAGDKSRIVNVLEAVAQLLTTERERVIGEKDVLVIPKPIGFPGDAVLVCNYRKKNETWEVGYICGLEYKYSFGRPRWHYAVRLKRKTPSKIDYWKNEQGKNLITLYVCNEKIKALKKGTDAELRAKVQEMKGKGK